MEVPIMTRKKTQAYTEEFRREAVFGPVKN
jgi:hypothetical protein